MEGKLEIGCNPRFEVEIESKLPEAESFINDQLNYNRYSNTKHPINDTFARGYNDGIDATLNALEPVRIIYNPPATIVFWGNGDKTVVKCSKNEKFNKYHGFCAAVAKRLFENNSQVTKIVNSGIEEKPVKKSKKSKETKKK